MKNFKFQYPQGVLRTIIEISIFAIFVSFFVFNVNKTVSERKEIILDAINKQQIYISNYIKENPDMVQIINREKNCSKGKIYVVEGCESYVYKDVTEEQKLKLEKYLIAENKFFEDARNKIENL